MPSVSAKQHRFMLAAAHNPDFAKRAGISQSVASEFVAADKANGQYKKRKSKREHEHTRRALMRHMGMGSQ